MQPLSPHKASGAPTCLSARFPSGHVPLCQCPIRMLTLPPKMGSQKIKAPDYSERQDLAPGWPQLSVRQSDLNFLMEQSEEAFLPILSCWACPGLALGSFILKCA